MLFRNFIESEDSPSTRPGEVLILKYDPTATTQDEDAIDTDAWIERYSASLQILVVRGHYKDKGHFRSAAQSLLLRSEICQQNITPLLCYKELPNSMHLLAAYQSGSTTLRDRRVDSFKEVLKMTYHVLQALAYLQGASRLHGDIRPSNVSYYEFEGLYKLNEMFVMNQKPIELNLKYAKDRNMELYMAPHVFNDILNRRLDDVKYNYYKNETFSLGMIIFSIVSRGDVQRVYDRSLRAFDMRLFQSLKDEIKLINTDSQLEQKFLRFVTTYMLNPDERQRLAPKRALNLLSKLIKRFMNQGGEKGEAEDLIEEADEGGLGEYLAKREEGGRAVQASKEGGGSDQEEEDRGNGEREEEVDNEENAAGPVQDSGHTAGAAGIIKSSPQEESEEEGEEEEENQMIELVKGEIEEVEVPKQKRNIGRELVLLAESMEQEQIEREIRKKKRRRKKKMLKKICFYNLRKVKKKIKRRRRASGMFVTMLKFNSDTVSELPTVKNERDIMRRSSINPFRPRSQTLMPGIKEETYGEKETTLSHGGPSNPFARARTGSLNPFMITNTLSRKGSRTESGNNSDEFNQNPFKRDSPSSPFGKVVKRTSNLVFGMAPNPFKSGPNPNAHISAGQKSAPRSNNPFAFKNPFMNNNAIKEEPVTPKSEDECGLMPKFEDECGLTPSELSLMDNMSLKIEVKGKSVGQKQNIMFLNLEQKRQILKILKPYLTTELTDPSSRMVININSRRASAEITIVDQGEVEYGSQELENVVENIEKRGVGEENSGEECDESREKESFEEVECSKEEICSRECDDDEEEGCPETHVMDMAKMILNTITKRNTSQTGAEKEEKGEKEEEEEFQMREVKPRIMSFAVQQVQKINQELGLDQVEKQDQEEDERKPPSPQQNFEITEIEQVTRNIINQNEILNQVNAEENYERQVTDYSQERQRTKTKFPSQMKISGQGSFEYVSPTFQPFQAPRTNVMAQNQVIVSETPQDTYYHQKPAEPKLEERKNFQLKSVITSIKTYKRPSAPRYPVTFSNRPSYKEKYVSYNQISNVTQPEDRTLAHSGVGGNYIQQPQNQAQVPIVTAEQDQNLGLYERGNYLQSEQTRPATINFQSHFLNPDEREFQMKINKTQYPLQQLESSMIKQSVINLASESAIQIPQNPSVLDQQKNTSQFYESGGQFNQTPSDWMFRGQLSSEMGLGMNSLNVTNNTTQMGELIQQSTVNLPSTNDLRLAEAEGGFRKKQKLDSRDFGMKVKSEEVSDTLRVVKQWGIGKVKSEGVGGPEVQTGLERIISIQNNSIQNENDLANMHATQASPKKINQWVNKREQPLQQALSSPKNNRVRKISEPQNQNNNFQSIVQKNYQSVISPKPILNQNQGRQMIATHKKSYPDTNSNKPNSRQVQTSTQHRQVTSSRTTYPNTDQRIERIRVTSEAANIIGNRSPQRRVYQTRNLQNIYRTVPVTGQQSIPNKTQNVFRSEMVASRGQFSNVNQVNLPPQSPTIAKSVSSQINRSNVLFKTHDSFQHRAEGSRVQTAPDNVIFMKSRQLASPRPASHTSFSKNSTLMDGGKRTFTSGLKIYKKVKDAQGNIVKQSMGESIDLYCGNILNKIQRESRQRQTSNVRNYASVQPFSSNEDPKILSTIPSERGIGSQVKSSITYQSSRVIPMSSSKNHYGYSGSKTQHTSSRTSKQELGYFRSNRVSPNIRPEYRQNGIASQIKRSQHQV